ncbi:hypothetical protein [Anderseniella sp. Alg231-50]|uniref:hypothetical protein n=1 Tax=Anderseniella sp. Alg231-50 TaxID=1922226 RepID=UPI00307C9123
MRVTSRSRWLIAIQVFLAWTIAAAATPSPSAVISDQIIGTVPDGFFVIRTTILRPPYYYQFRERVEFVELAIPSGKVRHRCTLRETDNHSDAAADKPVWTRTEVKTSACKMFETLSLKRANYIVPRSTGPGTYSFHLDAKGVTVKDNWSQDTPTPAALLPAKDIRRQIATIATIPAASLEWQTDANSDGLTSLLELGDGADPLHEACELDPVATTARGTTWLFLRFRCWSGDDDGDGAIFYLPADSATWAKDEN